MTYRSGWSRALPIFIGSWFVALAVLLLDRAAPRS